MEMFYLHASSLSSNVMILHEANFHIPGEVSLFKPMQGSQSCISLSIFHLSLTHISSISILSISCNFLHSNRLWRLNKWLWEKEDANAFVFFLGYIESNICISMLVYTNEIKAKFDMSKVKATSLICVSYSLIKLLCYLVITSNF